MSNNIDHANRAHAAFSPSGLKYLSCCSGFHGRDGSSEAAEMGTRIHEALEVRNPINLRNESEVEIYDTIVEMEESFMADYGFNETWQEINEIRMSITLPNNQTFGTCDRLLINPAGTLAVLADYKTGVSLIDPPRSNYQAKSYTVGAFQAYPDLETIHFAFYVPQHGSTLAGEFCRSELPALMEELDLIITKATIARAMWSLDKPPVDMLNPNQFCRFCRHEDGNCPALGGVIGDVYAKLRPESKQELPENFDAYSCSPEDAEILFALACLFEKWSEGTKDKVKSRLTEGEVFPNLRLKSMGAPLAVNDKNKLLELLFACGISKDQLLSAASLPIGAIKTLLGKGQLEGFLEEACSAEALVKSTERFTVR